MYKWKMSPLFALFCLGTAVAEPLVVSEYRADRDEPVPTWAHSLELSEHAAATTRDPHIPAEIRGQEISGSIARAVNLGGRSFTGFLNWTHRQNFRADEPFSAARSLRFGPKFSLTPDTETLLYYGYDYERAAASALSFGPSGDADTQRTGLAQIWYLADRRAEIKLGYEFAQGDRENFYQDMQGHSVNLSSRFPIGWGFNATVAADYTYNTYLEYEGDEGAEEQRARFSAAIDRTLSRRLRGTLHYSYLDQDEAAPDSYGRHAWGLNLKYNY